MGEAGWCNLLVPYIHTSTESTLPTHRVDELDMQRRAGDGSFKCRGPPELESNLSIVEDGEDGS